jgi:hypothetical protein
VAGGEQLSLRSGPNAAEQRDDRGHPTTPTGPGRTSAGRMFAPRQSYSYADWLDERDARRPAPPQQRVRLVTASGKTVGRTGASNAEHMSATWNPRYGPLTVLPL